MTIQYSIKAAYRGITSHKSRSFLTIVGITIGILSIILVMSIGQGAQNLILNQIQGLGSKSIIIMPGRQVKGMTDPGMIDNLLSDSLKQKDLIALEKKSNVPNLEQIMPIIFGVTTASNQGQNYRLTVFGATELISRIYDIYPSRGVFFNNDDVLGRNSVVIIGSKIEEKLFNNNSALGQTLRIKGRNFRVIGILPKKGQLSFVNFDEAIVMPYTTAQQYIFGIKHFHRILVQADSEQNINQTVKDIETTIRTSHNISDPEKDDFHIETQVDLAERVGAVTNILTLFLTSIAAISLLVGGIGIMNIMLVSVTERTREIGLRKALGATEKNILFQFLLESIMLTAIGGVMGIILGALFSLLVSLILTRVVGFNWDFYFPVSAVILGLSVAGFVGLVFGIYPAKRASQKSPIEALRYE